MMPVAPLLLAAVSWICAAGSAPAVALDDACSSEIGIFCRGVSPGRLYACLKDNEPDLLKNCRHALDAESDRMAAERSEAEGAAQEAKVRAEQGEELEARLTKTSGTVYLRTEAMAEGKFVAAEEGTPLSAGDHIRTGADGTAAVTVEGQSLILLEPESDLVVVSLHPDEPELYLGLGRLAAKLAKQQPGKVLRFTAKRAAAAVRGTELVVEQPLDDAVSRVGVLDEGHVSVQTLAGGVEVQLGPNQETEVTAKAAQPAKPLAGLAAAKPRLTQAKQLLAQAQKDWKPLPARPRVVKRMDLTRKPAVGPAAPAGIGAAQNARAYPEAQRRRAEIRARRAPKP